MCNCISQHQATRKRYKYEGSAWQARHYDARINVEQWVYESFNKLGKRAFETGTGAKERWSVAQKHAWTTTVKVAQVGAKRQLRAAPSAARRGGGAYRRLVQ